MRSSRPAWSFCLAVPAFFLLTLSFLGCSAASNNNSGGGGGGGGNGGGTGGGNLDCSVMSTGQTASLGGFVPFPSSSLWNTDISSAAVDPDSAAIMSNWVGAVNVHPDWGNDPTYGIPYTIVNGKQPLVSVNLGAYSDESDPGPMPVPANAPVEGGSSSTGDRHVLVLNNANCFLYELYNASPNADGTWNADSTAVWDLLADEQRPYTWTSADAAGLPIFPGLVRYDEVAAGAIKHAFRFTLPRTRAAFTPPASHWAGNTSDPSAPPMGMRLRLKASYDISGFSTQMQVILTAMKKYGLILADNGSSLYVTGVSDSRWGSDLDSLKTVPSSAFEVVEMNPVYTSANYPTGSAPVIGSFTSSLSHIASGGSVKLSWNVSNAQYVVVSPGAGVVRGTSVSVSPTATTTYTLYATNQFGRTSSTLTVDVP
ncbi:MAG TPA: hypothetical protein VMT53_19640 [Terriglobales bacterium]|nr:hypothetical protein [Terriglobales bacterium]